LYLLIVVGNGNRQAGNGGAAPGIMDLHNNPGASGVMEFMKASVFMVKEPMFFSINRFANLSCDKRSFYGSMVARLLPLKRCWQNREHDDCCPVFGEILS